MHNRRHFQEKKKKKLGAHVKNFARTFAIDMHAHNTTTTTHTHIYSSYVQSEGIHSGWW